MASPAEEGEAEAPEAGIEQARLNLVVTETGTANLHYEVGVLPLADGFRTTSIICIAVVAERLLVCLPFEVWSRKPADRLIHQRGLGKPLAVSLVSIPFDDRENPEGGFLKAWVGLLSEDLEATIEFGSDQDADVSFSPLADGQAVPYAPSLLEVANERFTFLSAESGAALGEGGAGGGALINGGGAESSQQGVTEARVAALEATLGSIQASLAALAKQPGAEKDAPGRKSALRRTRGDKAPAQSEMHVSFPGLDPAITQAALASGVGSAQLSEVSAILRNQPKRMEDLPRPSAASRRNELSESEDDEEEDDGHEDGSRSGSGDGSVAKAIVKLTKVCSALAEQKKKGGDHIENLLDQANMGGASSERFWVGRLPQECPGFACLEALSDRESRVHLQESGGQFDGRFHKPAYSPWRSNGLCYGAGMAGEPKQGAELHKPCAVDVVSRWHMGCPDQRRRWWCSCPGRTADCSWRPSVDRRRLMVALQCELVGESSSLPLVCEPQHAEPPRAAAFCAVRHPVGRAVLEPCQGAGFVPRDPPEAEQAGTSCGGRKQFPESQSKTKTKTERGRERKRQSREAREICRGRDGLPLSVVASACAGDPLAEESPSYSLGRDVPLPQEVPSRPEKIRVPGANAGTYSGRSLFNSFMRFIFQSKSGLGRFARSLTGRLFCPGNAGHSEACYEFFLCHCPTPKSSVKDGELRVPRLQERRASMLWS